MGYVLLVHTAHNEQRILFSAPRVHTFPMTASRTLEAMSVIACRAGLASSATLAVQILLHAHLVIIALRL